MIVRKANLLERLFGGLHDGADLQSPSSVVPAGISDSQRLDLEQREMHQSQQTALAVALRAAGYKVKTTPTGAVVSELVGGAPAVGKLAPTDVIVAVDGKRVRTPADVTKLMHRKRPGDTVTFTVKRGLQTKLIPIKTIADPPKSKRAIVGMFLEPSEDIHLPIAISIDAGNVGGPSAGLAFALDALQELGHNVDHGHQDRGHRRDLPQRRRRPDRRDQAEDDRRARGGCGRLPRPGRGERPRRPQVRARPAHHPCGEFSTGVAGPENAAHAGLISPVFRSPERAGNCMFSSRTSP